MARATVWDLERCRGKAELVNGVLLHLPRMGAAPGAAGDAVLFALHQHVERTGIGRAIGDNRAFLVELPHRESFSPNAAYYTGPRAGMRFYIGAPVFAVEVRSEEDYGPAAERSMAEKRSDYFAAGTLVVWDVDLNSPDVVRKFSASDPQHPTLFHRGQTADAEPAVPGWTMAVDDLFR